MKKICSTFLLAVAAGICIGIGGTAFLSLENKIAGALFFTVGLYIICVHGLNLYTGKIGYLPEKGIGYLPELLIIWLGNLAGTLLVAGAMHLTRFSSIEETAAAACEGRLKDSYGSLFLLAVFCGLLMFAAVDGYKKVSNPILLYACVAGFILCGFEHCIADMFYFSAGGAWSADGLLRILVITLGNSVGGCLIPVFKMTLPAEKK